MFSRRENWVFLPVVIIILILLFYTLFSVYISPPNRPQLSIYSDNWSDLSECRNAILERGYKTSSIVSTPTILEKFDVEEYANMVYMAIGVEREYSEDDAHALWEFVRDGGNIILADDFGHGNSFLTNSPYYNPDVKISNKRLFDQNFIKNTKFITINATLPVPGYRRYELILNEPSALEIKSTYYSNTFFTTLAASSSGGWVDENENEVRDPRELKGSYEIITLLQDKQLKGKIIIISDPGLFINDNWPLLDNWRYILDMLGLLLPAGGEVIFDESRHINENTFENSRHVLYSGLIYLTSTIWIILLVPIIIISFTIIIGVKIKPQYAWRNRNLLEAKYLNILNYPYEGPYDYYQIHGIFLEKVRLGYGFEPEEFRELDRDTFYKLIGDEYLIEFLTQNYVLNRNLEYFNFIKRRVLDWEPRHPDGRYFGRAVEAEPIEHEPSEYEGPTDDSSNQAFVKEQPINKFIREFDNRNYWR